MSLSLKTLVSVMKIRALNGESFYAYDLHLNGGEIAALSVNGYIEPTGNTKTILVHITTTQKGERIFKECTVLEWRLKTEKWRIEMYERALKREIEKAKEVLSLAEELGYEF